MKKKGVVPGLNKKEEKKVIVPNLKIKLRVEPLTDHFSFGNRTTYVVFIYVLGEILIKGGGSH